MHTTGDARYHAKREAGISPVRKDGSLATAQNDREAAAAEQYAALQLGCSFNASITPHGDAGHDFILPLEIEVVWLGIDKHTGQPRTDGHLIVNPYEPKRWADIYVVVQGSVSQGFTLAGWTTHKKLVSYPRINFGYGPKFALPVQDLYPPTSLQSLKRC